MNIDNKNIIYISIFSAIFVINIIVIFKCLYKKSLFEFFTDSDETNETQNNKSLIFKTFDEIYQRNPTVDELNMYRELKTKEDIIEAVNKANKPQVENKEENTTTLNKVEDILQTSDKPAHESTTIQNTLNTIDKISNNISFSKSFINSKIENIQKQLDDIKNLI